MRPLLAAGSVFRADGDEQSPFTCGQDHRRRGTGCPHHLDETATVWQRRLRVVLWSRFEPGMSHLETRAIRLMSTVWDAFSTRNGAKMQKLYKRHQRAHFSHYEPRVCFKIGEELVESERRSGQGVSAVPVSSAILAQRSNAAMASILTQPGGPVRRCRILKHPLVSPWPWFQRMAEILKARPGRTSTWSPAILPMSFCPSGDAGVMRRISQPST